MTVLEQARAAKRASFRLAGAAAELKDRALAAIADSLESSRKQILEANAKDQEQARKTDLKDALFNRLVLTDTKIDQIVASVRDVQRLEDPVGKTLFARELDQGPGRHLEEVRGFPKEVRGSANATARDCRACPQG